MYFFKNVQSAWRICSPKYAFVHKDIGEILLILRGKPCGLLITEPIIWSASVLSKDNHFLPAEGWETTAHSNLFLMTVRHQ